MKSEKGFTLVELLIVIVVIAILAAITIVAYNGIQTRANSATAKSNAESVQKVAEAYAADDTAGNGVYAATASALTSWSGGVARVPSGVSVVATALTSANKDGKTIQYLPKTVSSVVTGACIAYWDANTNAAVYVYAGAATTGNNTGPTCS